MTDRSGIGVCRRILAALCLPAFALLLTNPALAKTYKVTCPGEHKSLTLYVSGSYHGYPFSEVEETVLKNMACPHKASARQSLHDLTTQDLVMHVTVRRYAGQQLRGSVSVALLDNGTIISRSASPLSALASSNAPSVIGDDIYTTIQNAWNELTYAPNASKAVANAQAPDMS